MSEPALERRLRHLEVQLIGASTSSSGVAVVVKHKQDVASRIEALEHKRQSAAGGGGAAALSAGEWNDIDGLMEQLSPGTALTHQKQIMAPILYRRQEVLASAPAFKEDMERVAQILNLLLISQGDASKNRSSAIITEQQVVHAPILMDSGMSGEEKDKLEALAMTAVDLQTRVQNASSKLDRMLDNYARLVSAVSEKLVLADEEIRLQEQQKA